MFMETPINWNQPNAMQWEAIKDPAYRWALSVCYLHKFDLLKGNLQGLYVHITAMCRTVWYCGFGNTLRNSLQLEFADLCINETPV
jgi:hypothetical protein